MAEYIESVANADGVGEANKIKTPFAQIIVGGTVEKPCYSILWWDEEKKEGNIGYSSYYLEYVREWLKEEFEVTEELIAADVAPVVRCKECKFWQDNNGGYPHDECRWGEGETPDADDFCSYGERRADNG